MPKITIEKNLFCLPWTQTLLGTHLEGRVNFMALDWLTRVNYSPAMIGICVNKANASHSAILETKEFSINVPSSDMMALTDYAVQAGMTESRLPGITSSCIIFA